MGVVRPPQPMRTRSSATLVASHRTHGARLVLELCGEADITTEAMLREELAEASANADALVVDVSALRFCDVRSAHHILTADRVVPVTVVGAAGPVARVFDLLHAWRERGRNPARDGPAARPASTT